MRCECVHYKLLSPQSQFTSAAPISSGIGMYLLQKMGWKQGEGLGKHNEGSKEPLQLDFKIDRKGIAICLLTIEVKDLNFFTSFY